MKAYTIKPVENTETDLYYNGLDNDFLDMTPKSKLKKGKI